jgi:hypothetical protein
MTPKQFDLAYRAFCRRRPPRKFFIEFMSGNIAKVPHPEVVRREGDLYAMRLPDGADMVFAAESVSRLLDVAPEIAAKT